LTTQFTATNGHHGNNGHRALSPWPYTQPAVLDLLEGIQAELSSLAERIEELLEQADQAIEFVGARVEQARARERRRNRRGTRKAID